MPSGAVTASEPWSSVNLGTRMRLKLVILMRNVASTEDGFYRKKVAGLKL